MLLCSWLWWSQALETLDRIGVWFWRHGRRTAAAKGNKLCKIDNDSFWKFPDMLCSGHLYTGLTFKYVVTNFSKTLSGQHGLLSLCVLLHIHIYIHTHTVMCACSHTHHELYQSIKFQFRKDSWFATCHKISNGWKIFTFCYGHDRNWDVWGMASCGQKATLWRVWCALIFFYSSVKVEWLLYD